MRSVITIKTDEQTKKQAQQLAKDTGISLSGLINSYLKQIVATRQITVFAPEQMSPELEVELADVEKRRKSGQVSAGYTTAADFMKAIRS